jgi:molecular chaperone HtpG
MSSDQTAIHKWLKAHSFEYAAKLAELRAEVEGWLSYIPATFPHYTSHTVRHSDEIIRQISRLLFANESPSELVLPHLSPTEAYVMLAGAYLHDAGMVVSDQEKANFLSSLEFQQWIEQNESRSRRWQLIEAFRIGQQPPDAPARNFLADVQVRFLIAEYFRSKHHLRAGLVVKQYEVSLGRFAFSDPSLQRAIGEVCVAHGLAHHELEDALRFPESRDIRGDKVNVRFCAIILRLGDLLDLSSDRACPLLMNAACPIPVDSYPHWTQYREISRDISPERIEIHALCRTADEHRVLQDWCKWIVEEVAHARSLMARARRHADWIPPEATFGPERQTIRIERDQAARYLPVSWKFELDEERIFERFVRDAYESRLAFVRELVQNALDSMRCQMYEDLAREGLATPAFPTAVPEEFRARYKLDIRVEQRPVLNEMSGGTEQRSVLVVDDCGIGMDGDTIRRHLLQVGRSYYTTEEFRRKYSFVPTSRFGVGFLSVFADSDDVLVETWKPSSDARPIRLRLTGPRNYILVEEGQRRRSGTKIEVMLRDSVQDGAIVELIRSLCRRVEFQVVVDVLGRKTIVDRERADDFACDMVDPADSKVRHFVRAFPFQDLEAEGEMFVFGSSTSNVEDWTTSLERLHRTYPGRDLPFLVPGLTCLHGIVLPDQRSFLSEWRRTGSVRLDIRGARAAAVVGRARLRTASRVRWLSGGEDIAEAHWETLLRTHLQERKAAGGDNDWRYLCRMVGLYGLQFWDAFPGVVPLYQNGSMHCLSINQVLAMERIEVIATRESFSAPPAELPQRDGNDCALTAKELQFFDDELVARLIEGRKVVKFERLGGWARVVLEGKAVPTERLGHRRATFFSALEETSLLALGLGLSAGTGPHILIYNSANPLIEWWRTSAETVAEKPTLRRTFDKLGELIRDAAMYGSASGHVGELAKYLERWRGATEVPAGLRPPTVVVDQAAFGRRRGEF